MKFKNTYLIEDAALKYTGEADEYNLVNYKYEDIRIPGIVSTDKGVLVCYYEMRRSNSDWAMIDLGMKVSTDFGQTWSERMIIKSGEGKNTLNNPVMIAENERLHLLYCENYYRVFYRFSDDYGKTWSEDKELTEVFREEFSSYKWTVIAMGPGHGTMLSNGRFLVPVWLAKNDSDPYAHWPSRSATIYSDDKGLTWHAGEILPDEGVSDPNESCLCELSDGRIYFNARNTDRFFDGGARRAIAISDNGIKDWTNLKHDMNLIDPVCMGGMCSDNKGRILFTNCDSPDIRMYNTLKVSSDMGKTWEKIEYSFRGGYSDVCFNKVTNTAFVFYEARVSSSQKLLITEIDIDEISLKTNLN